MSRNLEFSKFEKAPYRSTVIGEEVTKGEQVGGDTPQKHNQALKLDQDGKESKKEQSTFATLSIKEMQKYVDISKNELERAVGMNPDWPPKSENLESARAEIERLEQSLNSFA